MTANAAPDRLSLRLGLAGVALALFIGATHDARAKGGGTMLQDPSLAAHVIYEPSSIPKAMGAHRLPIVVWGNGGCSDRGNGAQPFLTEVASHGYLVIAPGEIRPGPPPPPPPPPGTVTGTAGPPPGAAMPPMTRTAQLLKAIDWASAQNGLRGSKYFHRLDTIHVAAMGTSCGGLQAIEIGPDPRVKTVATFSSGLLDQPRPGANATRADLQHLHGPILYVVGGPTDGAVPHARKDYDGISAVPAVLAQDAAASHGGPLTQPNGGTWAPVAIAWLDWQLKGDRRAGSLFLGTACGLCTQAGWTVQAKGF